MTRSRQNPSNGRRSTDTVALGLTTVTIGLLYYVLPPPVGHLCLFAGLSGLVYLAALTAVDSHETREPIPRMGLYSLFIFPFSIAIGVFILTTSPTLTQLIVVAALLVVFFYYWFIIPAAWFQSRTDGSSADLDPSLSLSVLVPAYNEARYIGPCLEALLAATYPEPMEIIVIDDGSTDGTYYEANAYASDTVTVLRQQNEGKHSALNTGLARANGTAIVTVDADSYVAADALSKIVADLEADHTIGGVAGTVKLRETEVFVQSLQALEYAVGINTFRRAFAVLGAVNVVPGCLGCFRRSALESVGGYSGDTITEDFDVTLALLKAGWRVRASEATVWTVPPATWSSLYRQRIRWNSGNLETVRKHLDALWTDGRPGFTGIVYPYQLISLIAMPLATVVILATVLAELIAGNPGYVLFVFGLFTLLQVVATFFALVIDDADLRLLAYVPAIVLVYKYFMDAILLKALLDLLRGRRQRWNHERQPISSTTSSGAAPRARLDGSRPKEGQSDD